MNIDELDGLELIAAFLAVATGERAEIMHYPPIVGKPPCVRLQGKYSETEYTELPADLILKELNRLKPEMHSSDGVIFLDYWDKYPNGAVFTQAYGPNLETAMARLWVKLEKEKK